MRDLILIVVNACTTHLYAPGVRRHIENALTLGASREEILEAIQTTTLVGIHSCNLAVPILAEELGKASREGGARSEPGTSTHSCGTSCFFTDFFTNEQNGPNCAIWRSMQS